MKLIKSILIYSLTLLCIMSFLIPNKVKAESQNSSLTIQMIYNDNIIPDAQFNIYLLGKISSSGFVLNDTYNQFEMNINSQSNWDELAITIMNFIKTENIEPDESIITNENGLAQFSNIENNNIYLISDTMVIYNNITYTSLPFIITIPYFENDTFIYNVIANPKITEYIPEPTNTPIPTETPQPIETPEPSPSPLPQTGLNWQPVFICGILSGIFIMISIISGLIYIIGRKHEKTNKN